MSELFWLPVWTLWKRELVRFWREKARVAGFVASPLIFWLVLGSGYGDLGFFYPGTLTLTVMFSAVFSTMSIIEDRKEGFLLSMLVSPAPRSAMVLGKVLGAASLAWLQGAILLAFLPLAGFRPPLPALAGLAGVLYLVAFSFSALGFLIAWKMESPQGFHAVMNLLLFPLWMVSGALFGFASAHGWMQRLMMANPLTYATAALRRLLAPTVEAGTPAMELSILVTLACGILLWAAATLAARRQSGRSSA